MDAVEMQLALGRVPGLTAQQLRRALAAIEGGRASSAGLQGLSAQCRSSLESLGLSAPAAAALKAPDAGRITADRRWLERERVSVIDAAGAQYPPLLAQAEGAPTLRYVKGDPGHLSSPQLAMVGSRNPTPPAMKVPWMPVDRPSRCSAAASTCSTRASAAASPHASWPTARW
jgi:DNA processing protein